MAVKIKIDPRKVDKVVKIAIQAAEQVAYAIKQSVDEEQVVPFETGDLNNGSFVDSSKRDSGKFSLVFSTPYARRLYWHPEYNFRTDKNPNARGEWLEPWLTGDKKFFANRSFGIRFRRMLRQKGMID